MASNVERIARTLGIPIEDAARLCVELQRAAPPPVPSSFEIAQALKQCYRHTDGAAVDFEGLKQLLLAARRGGEKPMLALHEAAPSPETDRDAGRRRRARA